MAHNRLYGDEDPRELPAYAISEAAHYLRMPAPTLRSWVRGRYYYTKNGRQFFAPLIELPDPTQNILSFYNVVEAHVLAALRRKYGVKMSRVKDALTYLAERYHSKYPLISQDFLTDGLNIFIEQYGKLINITSDGQIALKELLEAHLQRIERCNDGIPIKLFPFIHGYGSSDPNEIKAEPRAVEINPYISFGQPVIVGTGITTSIIAERFEAGDSIELLAGDYHLAYTAIENALRFEIASRAA